MAESTTWLNDNEQRTWRAYILANHLLEEALDAQLQRDSAMTHTYFGMLTALVESGEAGIRMTTLASQLQYSPSRTSHAITSMERSGWVIRQNCPEDRRGQIALITPAGISAQADAAQGHVSEVRNRVIDRLSPEQLQQLESISAAILGSFEISDT